ncbi:hypothetical protein [Alteribacillus bidgolensis]|uniref:Uncharacterized protein n=1 Tax=Alteribacillus bidgolensis TaxID=930129 RepID=A0A1G8L3V0_9BACI|nr:hypothetical protein [Alteribacillus bidgolensis]SDI50315.1 hypothetical protein SAMN05216352_108140 [Alteribacillus bidgolensis]
MANILKVLTGIWFIILMVQVLSAYGRYIAEVPDYLLIIFLILFSGVIIREFKKGIVRELEQNSSGQ